MPGRGTTFTLETVLVIEECCNCHVPFGLTQEMQQALRRNKEQFYCPSGHPQSYTGESDDAIIKRLQREKDALEATRQRQIKQRDEWIDQEREHRKTAERQLSATKGVLTKTRKRVANGVCPCCGRTFVSLGRHMATQHPDYEGEPRTNVTPDALEEKAVSS